MGSTETRSETAGASPQRSTGADLYALVRELYPLCRSLTGQGVRETLDRIEALLPLQRTAVPSGTPVFDWEVPREWNVRDAWVQDESGRRVIDFRTHNLHLVSYSTPVDARLSLEELRPHLHALPDRPDWIPYRTSYYRESWGFCLTQRQLDALQPGVYEVRIDASLEPGALLLAEAVLPGESQDEILVWVHDCHPSLCNDNLSGIAVAVYLARSLAQRPRRFTYRFVFAPATIGAITWLAVNEERARRIRHGLVLASLGDRGGFTYKRSRRGDADVDRVATYLLRNRLGGEVEDFSPYGYDERQFCSPGFDLPVGRLTRTPNGRYPEYHTSADDLSFVTPEALAGSLAACEELLAMLESNRRYRNLSPRCEPRLGKRGLFDMTGGKHPGEFEHALLWVLSLSDGSRDLLGIAERSGLAYELVAAAAGALEKVGLVAAVESAEEESGRA